MSEDYRWVEMHRRMDKVERATEQVPVIQRDIAEIKSDIIELKVESRGIRKALYTTALSVMSAAVIFSFTVLDVFK